MITIPEPMQEALDRASGMPLRVVDPRTSATYVVLPAQLFDKMQSAWDGDWDVRDAYPLFDAVARQAGWDGAEWDSYNVYAREKET